MVPVRGLDLNAAALALRNAGNVVDAFNAALLATPRESLLPDALREFGPPLTAQAHAAASRRAFGLLQTTLCFSAPREHEFDQVRHFPDD